MLDTVTSFSRLQGEDPCVLIVERVSIFVEIALRQRLIVKGVGFRLKEIDPEMKRGQEVSR